MLTQDQAHGDVSMARLSIEKKYRVNINEQLAVKKKKKD
jgi:hypothetical protein